MQADNMEALFWFEGKEEGSCYWYVYKLKIEAQRSKSMFSCSVVGKSFSRC
jgi:hypothetical protein